RRAAGARPAAHAGRRAGARPAPLARRRAGLMSRAARTGAREVARRVIRRVDSEGAYLGLALAGELERARLSPEDRALATEIAYGVVRHRSRLDRALAAHAPRGLGTLSPAVRVALAAAAYQILLLDRVPPHAAVNDAVSAVRRVAGP